MAWLLGDIQKDKLGLRTSVDYQSLRVTFKSFVKIVRGQCS